MFKNQYQHLVIYTIKVYCLLLGKRLKLNSYFYLKVLSASGCDNTRYKHRICYVESSYSCDYVYNVTKSIAFVEEP